MIHILMTGGTIDSAWDTSQDSVVVSKDSNLPNYFGKFPMLDEIEMTQVCMKDSRALTREDLTNLLGAIEKSKSQKIVITHGTFTMPDTARFIKNKLKRKDQTIVFTGSVTPLVSFHLTDAGFNLGYAISAAQNLKAGIYICMRGKAYNLERLEKNIKEGKLHEIFNLNKII